VVIGDDEVDAEGGGKGGLLHAGDAQSTVTMSVTPCSASARIASQPRP